MKILRNGDGELEVNGRSWQEGGRLSARYWSEAVKEKKDSAGIFYYWNGERPLEPDAPQLEGTGEIRLESDERASGYFTTRSDMQGVNARTSGVYLLADPDDVSIMDGHDDQKRVDLIARQLTHWKLIRTA